MLYVLLHFFEQLDGSQDMIDKCFVSCDHICFQSFCYAYDHQEKWYCEYALQKFYGLRDVPIVFDAKVQQLNEDVVYKYFIHMIQHQMLTKMTTRLCHQLIKYPSLFLLCLKSRLTFSRHQMTMLFVYTAQNPQTSRQLRAVIQGSCATGSEKGSTATEEEWLCAYSDYLYITRYATHRLPREIQAIFAPFITTIKQQLREYVGIECPMTEIFKMCPLLR